MSACARRSSLALLATFTAVAAMGCSLDDTSSPSSTDDPTCTTAGCGTSGFVTLDALIGEDLPHNGLVREAITDLTLTAASTQNLLQHIQLGGLTTTGILTSYDRSWISSKPEVNELMRYVVSCALDRGVTVNPGVFVQGEGWVSWPGELGLCGALSVFGNWASTAPTQACMELVSSCVLARVNALHKKVVISMNGESSAPLPFHWRVPVVKEYRENDGTPIRSFAPCTSSPPTGPSRDCGWERKFVGSCMPDKKVTIETRLPAMLRVCKGIYGCDHTTLNYTPWYAGVLKSVDASVRTVTFTCPRNGVSLSEPSFFAIMLASTDPAVFLDSWADVDIIGGGAYPSPEDKVFPYREGAFFGNIFKYMSSSTTGYVLVGSEYTCYSNTWSDGLAHDADRLCATPDSTCFTNPPQPCSDHCSTVDSGPPPAYLNCSWTDPFPEWKHPITVHLNNPCDLSHDIPSCRKAYPNVFIPGQNW